MSDLTYAIKDVAVLETFSQRRPNIQATSVIADADYQMLIATVSQSTNDLYVETQYTLTLHGSEDTEDDGSLATLRTRVGVILQPSRVIKEDEVQDGTLLPSQQLARQVAQSYHRLLVAQMSTQLGLMPIQLPADFDQVAEGISGAANPASETVNS